MSEVASKFKTSNHDLFPLVEMGDSQRTVERQLFSVVVVNIYPQTHLKHYLIVN